jgi:hypothetical protein
MLGNDTPRLRAREISDSGKSWLGVCTSSQESDGTRRMVTLRSASVMIQNMVMSRVS